MRQTWQAEDSRVYWHPDAKRYGRIKLRLSDYDWLNQTDWQKVLVEAARKRGLRTGVELSHTVLDAERTKSEFADCVQRNIHGESQVVWGRGNPICLTRFFWGDIDVKWFPEACLSNPRFQGYYTVRHFIEGGTMPGAGVLNIIEWRTRLLARQEPGGVTPLEIAATLEANAAGALKALPQGHWKDYSAAYTRQYVQPVLYNRVGRVDIPKLTEKVAADVQQARHWQPGTINERQIKRSGTEAGFKKQRPPCWSNTKSTFVKTLMRFSLPGSLLAWALFAACAAQLTVVSGVSGDAAEHVIVPRTPPRTGLIYDDIYLKHDTGAGHLERQPMVPSRCIPGRCEVR